MNHTSLHPAAALHISLSLSQIIRFLSDLEHTRRLAVAGVVILTYDWILTLGEEVTYLWPSKLTPTKVVFLANRYINIVSQFSMIINFTGALQTTSQRRCVYYIIGYGVVVFLTIASVHVLVLLRTWAICNRQPWTIVALGIAYMLYAFTCIALIVYAAITASDSFIFNLQGTCISFAAQPLWYAWLASLFLEYITFAFTLTIIYRHYAGINPGFRGLGPLPRRLCRSAFFYILFATVSHVFSIIVWRVFWDTPYNMLAVTFNSCLLNVAGQRFVLNLRSVNNYRNVQLPRFSGVVIGVPPSVELESVSVSKVP